MASETTSPLAHVEDLPTALRQLHTFSFVLGWVTAGFAILGLSAGVFWRDLPMGATGAIVTAYSICVWIAYYRLARGELQAPIILLAAGVIIGETGIAIVFPELGPTLALASLIPLILATHYAERRARNYLLIATALSTAGVILAWRFLNSSFHIPDGFLAFYQVTSMFAATGMSVMLCWQIRQQLQERLNETGAKRDEAVHEKARYEAFLRSQYDVIIATDERGCVTLINAAAEQFTGWTLREVEGRHIADTFCFETTDTKLGAEDFVDRVLQTRKGFLELRGVKLIARNHDRVWHVTVSAAPIVSGDRLLGAIFTFRDLTDHMRTLERDQAAERMKVVERMAAGIAPEFDDALTCIGALGRKIGEQVTMGEMPDIDDVNGLVRAGEKAANMARQLLAIGQRQSVRPETIDFGELVAQIAQDLPKTLGRDVCVIQQNEQGIGRIKADRQQLTDAIYQVANYARDTMPAGGTLHLEASNVFLDVGSLSDTQPDTGGAYVRLVIRDSGGGWNQKDLLHLLEPFYEPARRASGRAQSAFNLSVVNGLVRQNGGWLSVDSQLRVGSTYTIHFPRVDVEEWLAQQAPGYIDVWPQDATRPTGGASQGIHM
jgi:PAS domain S-box-containing protein